MTKELEKNYLDYKIYSAIKKIRGQKNRAHVNPLSANFTKCGICGIGA